jgi:hypothetical protein
MPANAVSEEEYMVKNVVIGNCWWDKKCIHNYGGRPCEKQPHGRWEMGQWEGAL